MNGRIRHKKHRRRRTGQGNSGIIILISVVAVIAVIGTLLIFGNYLNNKKEKQQDNEINSADTVDDTALGSDKRTVTSIKGYPVLIEAKDGPLLSTRLDSLVLNEKNAISISLNTTDGILLYNSEIAKKIGISTNGIAVSAEDISALAKERSLYISGVYYVNAFSENDALLRSVELSKSTALIAEALNAGFDEILIVAPQMTDAHINEAIRFVEDIKALSENGAVGLTVPEGVFSLEDSVKKSEIISSFDEKIDFLAIDVSLYKDTEVISEILGKEQFHLHMYKMRVILPYASDESLQNAFITATEETGIGNWQILMN